MLIRKHFLFAAPFLALALAAAPGALADDNTVVQAANMHDPGDSTIEFAGAGILTRSKKGVAVSLHMTGLQPLGAYTAWWIVFNEPDDCTDPCGLDDLIAGIGQGFYATGYVAGAGGSANAYASLPEGPIPEGADRLSTFFGFDPATETGLKDSFDAEIHLIAARSHGEVQAGLAADQIGSFDGNCGGPPDFPDCADLQAVAFLAVDGDDD